MFIWSVCNYIYVPRIRVFQWGITALNLSQLINSPFALIVLRKVISYRDCIGWRHHKQGLNGLSRNHSYTVT